MSTSKATEPQPGPGGYIYRGFSMPTVLTVSAVLAVALYFIPFETEMGLGTSIVVALFATCAVSFYVEMRRKREAGDFDRVDD